MRGEVSQGKLSQGKLSYFQQTRVIDSLYKPPYNSILHEQ